jgi:hypothetical protein
MQKFATVSEFTQSLDEAKRAEVELLRSAIMNAEPGLTEHIKWNAPSYVWDGVDRITFNVLNKEGTVKLVLHLGGTRKEVRAAKPIMQDSTGLVEWISDIRGTLTFKDPDDVTTKHDAIVSVIKSWLSVKP